MAIENPFVFGKAAEGTYFTDRTEDAKRLNANLTHGINTILISPRRWGKTSLVKKVIAEIDKPDITPIEMNREASSAFYKELMSMEAERSQPQFLDFDKDLTRIQLPNGVELLYRQNTENDLSELAFMANKGSDQQNTLLFASYLLDYLGTDKLSTEQYQKALTSFRIKS